MNFVCQSEICLNFALSFRAAKLRGSNSRKADPAVTLDVTLPKTESLDHNMADQLPVSAVIPTSEMRGENEEETARLRRMEAEVRAFLTAFKWCGSIRELYFGDGIGDVVAVFLARIEPWGLGVDEYLWIVVGDLPPAYLVVDDCPTPKAALRGYIAEMREWVAVAEENGDPSGVIPVNVPATPESASALRARLDALENDILPVWWPGEANLKTE
jgi:hypothetical protein